MSPAIPFLTGFTVLDGVVANMGGVELVHRELLLRIERARHAGHLPAGAILFRYDGRLPPCACWIVETSNAALHAAMAELVVAWEETNKVDTVVVLS